MANKSEMPPAVILCGGQGTRLRDVTELLPKPMVRIGAQPIIWHIMKSYAAFNVKRFILCLGYKKEAFIEYFLNYHAYAADITVKLGGSSKPVYHNSHNEDDWEVTLSDTGDYAMTGSRIARIEKYLQNDDDFFLTYGDAVADVNIADLLQAHRQSDKDLTVTAVHPVGRFGEIDIEHENGRVSNFFEKPQIKSGYINGGFMVMKKTAVAKYLTLDRGLVFEQEPMRDILAQKEMQAFKHEGFWQCMDTPREHALLNKLWDSGAAPWTSNW